MDNEGSQTWELFIFGIIINYPLINYPLPAAYLCGHEIIGW